MNRRQLLFVVLLNSLISLVLASLVVWLAEMRRPNLEELAAQYTPAPPVVLIATPTSAGVVEQPVATSTSPSQQAAPDPTPTPANQDPEIYVVQTGDSLFGIALEYNLTVDQLMEANNISDPNLVFSGQQLTIPRSGGSPSGSEEPTANANQIIGELTLQVEQPGNLSEENVLIVNESNSAVNLQGWTLGKVNGPVYALGDLPLFPGGSVRLHSESGQDDSLNLYWGQSSPIWEPGAVARLFNSDGREVASYTVP